MRKTGLAFDRLCELSGLPKPVAEYRFAPPRRWRFDYAFIVERVALEVQGGLFVAGRHSRGAALLKEHEKLNEAAAQGWRVLFTTPDRLESTATLDLLRRVLRVDDEVEYRAGVGNGPRTRIGLSGTI